MNLKITFNLQSKLEHLNLLSQVKPVRLEGAYKYIKQRLLMNVRSRFLHITANIEFAITTEFANFDLGRIGRSDN